MSEVLNSSAAIKHINKPQLIITFPVRSHSTVAKQHTKLLTLGKPFFDDGELNSAALALFCVPRPPTTGCSSHSARRPRDVDDDDI